MKLPFPAGLVGIIYDCDGVMIDSADGNRHLYNMIMAELGLPPITNEQAVYAFQATFEDALKFLVPREMHSSIEAAISRAVNYDVDILPRIRLMPGYRNFIERAHRHGLRQAIDTNRTDYGIDKIIVRFGLPNFFDPVISSTTVVRPKPAPEGVDKIRAVWKCEPGQILFIGDSPDDRTAAQSGGAIFAAFNNPDIGGDLEVASWDELAEFLWPNDVNQEQGA